jgi:hypothetical protein
MSSDPQARQLTDTFVRSTLAEIEALLADRVAALAAAFDEVHSEAARTAAEVQSAALEAQAAAAAEREQALRAAHDAALDEVRSETGGEVARLVAERAADLDSARAEYDLAVSALRDDVAQLTASIDDARALHAVQLEAVEAAHREEVDRLGTAHREQLEAMRIAHGAALADLRASHEAELDALRHTIPAALGPAAADMPGSLPEAPVEAWDEQVVALAPEAAVLAGDDDAPAMFAELRHEGAAMPKAAAEAEASTPAPGRVLTLVGADWFRDHDEAVDYSRDGAQTSTAEVSIPVTDGSVPVVEGTTSSAAVEAIVEGAVSSAPMDVIGESDALSVSPGTDDDGEPVLAGLDRPRPKSLERMRDALAQLDGAASLKDTLDRLADVLAEHSPRSMVFIVRGDWLRGWRFNGFGDHAPAADSVVLAIEHTGEFRPVIEEGARADVHPSRFGGAMHSLAFAHLDGEATGVAVPVRLTGKSVAVLYVDEGEPGRAATGGAAEAVEILARHASRCLEAITATRSVAALGARANGAGSNQTGQPARRDAGSEHQGAPEGAAGLAVVPAPPVAPPSPEVLAAAERFAALVVSEIKLYNEAAIQMGRKKRDLRTRLHAEIDRASGLFGERMGAVPGHEAIFERELVRVLAGGDAELLGRPRAEAV